MSEQPPQLLSILRAAAVLDCSRAHVYRLIATGKLRAVEIAATGTRSKTRVRAEDLEAFIEERTRRHLVAPSAREEVVRDDVRQPDGVDDDGRVEADHHGR